MSVILEAKHISKNFGLTQALKDVSVTIDEGEVIGLIGENGSGKSTLVKSLLGLKNVDKGKIVFDDGLFPEFIRNLKESLLWTENHINQQIHWMHRIMESV